MTELIYCPGSSNRSPPSCGLVIAWRTNCAVAQLAMNPLQQRAPFLLRKVRKSKRSGDYSSHQSIAIFPPKNSTALDLMPTIYLLRERSGITLLGQSLGKRADRRRRCSRPAYRVGWILKQLGAATAKDPSLVASLVCRLSGLQQ